MSSRIKFVPLDPGNPTGIKFGERDLEMLQGGGPLSTGGVMSIIKRAMSSPQWRISAYRNMLEVIDRVRPSLMVIDVLNLSSMDAAMTRNVPFAMTVPAMPSTALRLPWNYPSPVTGLPKRMSPSQQVSNVWFKFRLRAAILLRTPAVSFVKSCRSVGIENARAHPHVYADAAAMVITSSVFGLEYAFPVPSHARLIGAFLPPEPDDLRAADPDLSRWLDDRTSVVYLGFGTLMRLSPAQLAALLEAIRRLGPEHAFLWKLPESQQELLPTTSLPDNLRIESWMPSQPAVLAHPHVRAFVTHGGSNGFHESIHYGKPVLVMPAWTDCHGIARRAVDSGVGLAIDRPAAVTGDEATTKLRRILTEDSFRERAEYWGQRLRDAGGAARAADLILDLRARLEGQPR